MTCPFPVKTRGGSPRSSDGSRTTSRGNSAAQTRTTCGWTTKLPSNARATPEIDAKVRDSAILLLILSDGYLASEWCGREMSLFLDEEIKRRKDTGSRIFVVEYSDVQRPPALKDVVGSRFWEMDARKKRPHTLGFLKRDREDERYSERVLDLCHDIVAELKCQKAQMSVPEPTTSTDNKPARNRSATHPGGKVIGPTVYLAEVSDDLEDMRDEVKRYLVQAGYGVLPQSLYPSEPAGFEAAARADLERSDLFVQLLSGVAGRKLDGSERRRVAAQHEMVVERMPVLQWRSRDLDVGKATNPAHRALLDGPDVMAVDIAEFKGAIARRVAAILAPAPPKKKDLVGCDLLVFINAAEDDIPLAECVSKELDRRSISYVLPLRVGKPSEIGRDLDLNLTECDALMLIFGRTEPLWVKSQILRSRKIMASRERPLHVIGIYEGPPPKPENGLGIKLSNVHMHVLKCHAGPDRAEIEKFVSVLQARCEA